MHALIRSSLGLALCAGAMSTSAADISGNVTLASDYRFRGISQLEGNISPALQGGFDFKHESGLYIGTWASNVNFVSDVTFDDGEEEVTVPATLSPGALEIDVYGGFSGSFNESVSYDLGVLYYGYPDDEVTQLDYLEFYGSVSFAGLKLGLNYSDDYFAETGEFFYPYADYSYTVNDMLTLSAHLGYNSFDETTFLSNGDDNYTDWKLAAATTALGVTWTLAYVDTDLDDDEDCYGNEDLCEATAVVSISKSL